MAEADSYLDDDSQPPITFSMVTISHCRSNHLPVFPPINHEGLHISSDHQPLISPQSSSSPAYSSSSSSSSSFSSSTSITADSDESDGYSDAFRPPKERRIAAGPPRQDCLKPSPHLLTRVPSSLYGWMGFGLEILRRRVQNLASFIPGHAVLVGAFRSFPLMTTAAAVYVASLVLSWARRRVRRSRKHEIDMLLGVIRERDEKIVKLLDQIARLNELLLGHQRSQ